MHSEYEMNLHHPEVFNETDCQICFDIWKTFWITGVYQLFITQKISLHRDVAYWTRSGLGPFYVRIWITFSYGSKSQSDPEGRRGMSLC